MKIFIRALRSKLAVVLLAFLFIIQPIAPVFADDAAAQASTPASTAPADTTPTANSSTSTDSTVTTSPDNSSTNPSKNPSNAATDPSADPSSSSTNSSDKSVNKKSGPTPQALNSPIQQQDPTSVPKSTIKQLLPQTEESSGALIYQYPIAVPPGRNGLQPDLKLTYNNQAPEDGAIFGSGWSLNIPYIERINRKGSEQLYSQNYFNSSLTGELLLISGSTWGSKVDNGEFLNYTLSSSTWTVKDKNGTTYTFGAATGSRQDDPGDSTRIYKWMLSEVRDANNNYIKYTYYKDAGQIYPSSVIYTGNGSTDGVFEIDFQRQSRGDVVTLDKPQFAVTSNYRINEIDAKVNGTLNHEYALSYSSGANGAQSLLGSITESGVDDSSVTTTLPAETLSYQGQTASWTSNTNWAMPSRFMFNSTQPQATQMADVNGDGLLDVLFSGYEWVNGVFTPTSHVWINNGNGWTLDNSWTIPELFEDSSYNDLGTRMADVNGDGKADIISTKYVYTVHTGGSTSWDPVSKVYINNGTGWTYDSSWTVPTPIVGMASYTDLGVRIYDVNGDGLPDILSGPASGSTAVYLNTGTGWAANNTNWVIPSRFMFNTSQQQATDMADVNGDGLLDFVFSGYEWVAGVFTPTSHVWLNNGNGWTLNTSWSIPELLEDASYNDLGTRFADVNGDGLADVLSTKYVYTVHPGGSTSWDPVSKVYINNGTGWTYDSAWTIPNPLVGQSGADNGTRIYDINGDGMADIVNAFWTGTNVTYTDDSKKIDSLTQIANPKGGTTTVTYKPSTQYVNGSTLLNPKLPIILETASQISNSDGLGNTSNSQYQYEGGELYFNGPFDRKFAGYSKVTTTDDAGNKVINYYHQGDTTDSTHGEYSDDIPKAGKIYRTEITDGSGNMYSKTINKWDEYSLGSGRTFVKQIQKLSMTYDGDTTHKDSAETYTYDNSTGNITQKVQLGQVTGADDGTYTDTGTDDFTTAYTYATDGAYIVGLPDDVTVTDHSSTKVKEDKYYYDAQALGTVTKGNQTKHEMWNTGSTYINTQKGYDSTYGVVTSDTDARGKVTSYTLDSYHLYPATVTDPLSHATSYTYDYSSGQVIQTTDPNSRVFQNVYDGLDRLIAVKQPDQTSPTTLVTKTAYAYTDTSGSVSVHKTDNLDGSNARETYIYIDGLGRKIQDRTEAEGTNYEVKDYAYNNVGLLQKESLPYFSSGSSKTTPTSTTSLYINYAYDPMQRITTTTDNVGTVTNTYNDWKLTITDKRGKNKDLYKDAYGNLIQVDEHNSGSTYSTYYTYDYLGDLLSVTDALSNVRNFTYNGLGQRLTATDLHASGDTTYGSYTYTYDNNNNLTQKVDPNGNTINYTYDDINRPLTEDYTGHTGTEVTYVYDSGTDGIGHLTSVTAGAYTQGLQYNPIGLLKQETKTISTVNYITAYTYDRQGNQLTITNPDSSVVQYEYDTAGLLEKVSTKESGAGSYTYVVDNFDYSPMEQPTTVAYTNGMTTTNTYDATKLYRLSTKVTTIASSAHAQDLSYTYDNNGNITQIVDASATSTSKTGNYTYDDLNRLTQAAITAVASGQSTYTKNYTYDAIGNISTGGAGTYTYGGNTGTSYANPHAVTATSTGSVTYTYDHNGNELTKGSALTNTWDYNNRLTQAVAGGTTDTYTYDATGERLTSNNGTTTTTYATKFYNTDGTTPTKHIFANGVEVGTVTGSGTITRRSVANDNVTGSNIITNTSDTADETLDYYPFGGIRIDSGSYNDQRKFAGHEYDADTSLSYMDARYYDSAIGKFASQDSAFLAIGDPSQFKSITQQLMFAFLSDPQRLNSYSYVENNPMSKLDPTGQFSINPIGFLSNNTQITIGNWANNVAASSSTFNYATGHKWVGYTAGGIGIAAGAGAGLLYGGAALGYTTLANIGQICLFACTTAQQLTQNSNAINISEDALSHIIDNHTLEGAYNDGKSLFNSGENVSDLIKSVSNEAAKLQENGNLQRVVDIGRNIGLDRATGQQTQWLTVITDKTNNLVTSFPGLPGKVVK